HQRLAAARCGFGDVDVNAVIRRIFIFEEHLAFDVDRFNQAGHGDSLAAWLHSTARLRSSPGPRLASARASPPILRRLAGPSWSTDRTSRVPARLPQNSDRK